MVSIYGHGDLIRPTDLTVGYNDTRFRATAST